jgi:hypothetical protein
MNNLKVIAPYIALHYLILVLGIGFVKFIVYADALAVLALFAAPALTAFTFVKVKNRLLTKAEAFILIAANGTPVFLIFATLSGSQFNEPHTGWLLRLLVVIFGALLGYGICAVFYLGKRIWSNYVKA